MAYVSDKHMKWLLGAYKIEQEGKLPYWSDNDQTADELRDLGCIEGVSTGYIDWYGGYCRLTGIGIQVVESKMLGKLFWIPPAAMPEPLYSKPNQSSAP